MAGYRLTWRGPEIGKAKDSAVRDGIDMTTAAATNVAQQIAPVDTGFYKNTIEFWSAKKQGNRIVGSFGNATADYSIWIEIGARGRPGQYVLRRAADREFPNLLARVRAAMRW